MDSYILVDRINWNINKARIYMFIPMYNHNCIYIKEYLLLLKETKQILHNDE